MEGEKDPVLDPGQELDKGASESDAAGVQTNVGDEPLSPREGDDATSSAFNDYQSIRDDVQQRGDRSWHDLSEYELNSVIANPIAYGKYLPGALSERERRFEEKITGRLNAALETNVIRAKNPEAFNKDTPLGKEVQKIMGQKSYSQMFSDVMELAANRISRSKVESETRKKITDNMKAAMNSPGTDTTPMTSPLSWSDMPKQDFEANISKVKLERKE